MKLSLRWLSEFVDLPTQDPDELAHVLSMLGHEVEGWEVLRGDWTGVCVGKVTKIAPHPDADKIRVCQVDSGGGPQQIICGAWNFEEGAYVPVARPGAVLPGDFQISVRSIRGVESNGMICSEAELGIGSDHDGILVLDGTPPLGTPLADVLELPDVVFDLTITPNRPDAMSVHGIARDLGAHYRIEVREPVVEETTIDGEPTISVTIADSQGCRRFVAREIVDVKVGKSPFWMRHRLRKAGIRSISNVVDVTNYVMVELGHPLHAFDADAIKGNHLTVRRASSGEKLVTLDDVERTLTEDDLIIYDEEGPTSMAGTMGGNRSEVSPSTRRVLMEAASWDPPTIMYMSRRHGLRSEASTRFERGVDPVLAELANRRAAHLVAQFGQGSVLVGIVDETPGPIVPIEVELRLAEVERLLGPGFDADYVAEILESLGMEVGRGDPMSVIVPTFRPDVERPADLIEEIARIHGYEKFASTVPFGRHGGLTSKQRRLRDLHGVLVGAGLNQAVTLSLVGKEVIERLGLPATSLVAVKNPLREEERYLRNVMLPSLMASVAYNLSHGGEDVALFETGRVFESTPSDLDSRLPCEEERLCVAITGTFGIRGLYHQPAIADAPLAAALMRHVTETLGIEDLVVEPAQRPGMHPGRTGDVVIGGKKIGYVAEVLPSVARSFGIEQRLAVIEVALEPILAMPESKVVAAPSTYPHSDFDLSFVLPDDARAGDIVAATRKAGAGLVESARAFDEFSGASGGHRAVAIRYRLRAPDRTLTGEEVAEVRTVMIAAGEVLGARLRGAE